MTSIVSASTGDQEGKGSPPDRETGRKGRSGGLKNELVVRRHWLAAVSTRFQPDDGD